MHLTALSHRTRSGVWAQYTIGQILIILRYVEKGWFSRAEIAEETGPFGLIAPGCLGGVWMAEDIVGITQVESRYRPG